MNILPFITLDEFVFGASIIYKRDEISILSIQILCFGIVFTW